MAGAVNTDTHGLFFVFAWRRKEKQDGSIWTGGLIDLNLQLSQSF
jgi:hypothetical protein